MRQSVGWQGDRDKKEGPEGPFGDAARQGLSQRAPSRLPRTSKHEVGADQKASDDELNDGGPHGLFDEAI